MRKIKIDNWKAKIPIKDKEGNITDSKDVDENLLIAFNMLLGLKKPEELPRGLEKFRIFGKLSEAFDKVDKTNVLEVEEREYNFLKELIEKDIPSAWGMNKELSKAVNDFLNAKEEWRRDNNAYNKRTNSF